MLINDQWTGISNPKQACACENKYLLWDVPIMVSRYLLVDEVYPMVSFINKAMYYTVR